MTAQSDKAVLGNDDCLPADRDLYGRSMTPVHGDGAVSGAGNLGDRYSVTYGGRRRYRHGSANAGYVGDRGDYNGTAAR